MKNFVIRMVCPVCSGTDFQKIYSLSYMDKAMKRYLETFYGPQGGVEWQYLVEAKYTLLECKKCHLIFQQEVPDETLMFKLYEEWIDPLLSYERNKDLNQTILLKYRTDISNTISYISKTTGGTNVLDFGFGWGHWSQLAIEFGCAVYGTELSPTRLEHAKKLNIKILDFDSIKDYQFDFINADQVFEHLAEPMKTLQVLKKSLTKNGIIKIDVPNGNMAGKYLRKHPWTQEPGLKARINYVAPLEHINCFRLETLLKLTQSCGLELFNFPTKYKIQRSENRIKQVLKIINYKLNPQKKELCLFFKKNINFKD
jgi:2-polyprenyl-3-methyl-5-hydroxy-6-metoxy-1,4-benzoquinol methylase